MLWFGLNPTQVGRPAAVMEPTCESVTVPVSLTNQLCAVSCAPFQKPAGCVRAVSERLSVVPDCAEASVGTLTLSPG